MIGGTDVILEVKPGVSPADVIFRVVRRYWPQCLYQNAGDESAAQPVPPGTTLPTLEPEFFLYRDEEAARSWDEFGATPENGNSMLYVLLPEPTVEAPGSPTVTVVCGELVGEMRAMMAETLAELSPGTSMKPEQEVNGVGRVTAGAAGRE
jgi:hypothetical protein